MTDGQSYDVRHPEFVFVLRTRLLVGLGGGNGVPDRAEHLALAHVVRLEELPTEARQSAN
ncbi:MAG: hypothetical protein ACREJB_02040 [Planctomycetaceae bacterium]